MATAAISGLSMGLYKDDPTQASVVFSSVALVDGVGYQDYKAASGYRYWDPTQTLLIEKQTHGAGNWNTVVPDYIWWTSGMVHFETPLNNDDLVRGTGKRRTEANFTKILNLTKLTIKANGKTIDTTSADSGGWEECMAGFRTFEGSSEEFWYWNATTYPDLLIRDFLLPLYCKFYSNYSGAKAWGGLVQLTNYGIIDNINAAQKQTLTFKGDRELLPELS